MISTNDFFEHLVEQGLSASTATHYDNCVRRAIRRGVDPLDGAGVDEWLSEKPRSYGPRKSAMNALLRFNNQPKIGAVEDAVPEDVEFTFYVKLALAFLHRLRGVEPATMAELCWSEVDSQGPPTHPAEIAALAIMFEWAQPWYDECFVVPAGPGSLASAGSERIAAAIDEIEAASRTSSP